MIAAANNKYNNHSKPGIAKAKTPLPNKPITNIAKKTIPKIPKIHFQGKLPPSPILTPPNNLEPPHNNNPISNATKPAIQNGAKS